MIDMKVMLMHLGVLYCWRCLVGFVSMDKALCRRAELTSWSLGQQMRQLQVQRLLPKVLQFSLYAANSAEYDDLHLRLRGVESTSHYDPGACSWRLHRRLCGEQAPPAEGEDDEEHDVYRADLAGARVEATDDARAPRRAQETRGARRADGRRHRGGVQGSGGKKKDRRNR